MKSTQIMFDKKSKETKMSLVINDANENDIIIILNAIGKLHGEKK